MELSKPAKPAIRGNQRLPNMFYFPKELRDAIPEHSARALVFDSASGDPGGGFPPGTRRALVSFLVHETGRLEGQYVIRMDIDAPTLRALGQFLAELAEQADRA